MFKKISLFILLLTQVCIGQNDNHDRQLTFYKLDTEDGLSNNLVRVIEQDTLGFIWIGTADGINRYDGNDFTVFRKENSALANNYLQNIVHHTNTGNLLVGSDGGFDLFNLKTNSFEHYNAANTILSNSVNSFAFTKSGTIYAGDFGIGIRVFKDQSQQKVFKHEAQNSRSLSSNEIISLHVQNDSTLWIGTRHDGLNKINLKTQEVARIPIHDRTNFRVNALFIDRDDHLWLGTNEGIKILTQTTALNPTIIEGLAGSDITSFEEDAYGRIWVGTYDEGLKIISKSKPLRGFNDLSITNYLPKDDGTSVFNATVFSIKKDRSGNMWLGTYAGINYVNPRGEPVKLITNSLNGTERITHNRINAIAEDASGKLFIGTDGGGVDQYDPKTNTYAYAVFNEANALKSNHVLSLLQDTNNQLWIGTYLGGLSSYNKTTKQWQHYLQGEQKDGNDVRVLYQAKNEHIWVGTNRGGLFVYDNARDAFKYITELGKVDIRDIAEDSRGNLWLATYGNGIIHYNLENKRSTHYNSENLEGLTTNVVFSIVVTEDDAIIAGTKHGGLVHFNPESKEALNLREDNGLSNNTINSIIAHDSNSIWLGTFKGISKYDPISQKIENLTRFNNIHKSEYNPGAALKAENGALYFGSNKGLNQFRPENLKNYTTSEALVIKDLLVFNESVAIEPTNKKAILNQAMPFQESIQLNAENTVFSIDFTSLDFPIANNTQYSYILEGYNDHWIDLKNSNRINFSNISPGYYTLKIKAETLASTPLYKELVLTILPPFWQTWPAYLFYIVTLIILIYSGLRYYSERVYLKNSLHFEQKQRKLEHELNEERVRFYTGFSHELKTPLTLILAPLENLLDEIVHKQHRKSLKLIKRNAHNLHQFINKLLEFRKSEEGLSQLTLNNYNLTKNLSNWLGVYEPLLKKKNLDLVIQMSQTPVYIYCDLEKIQVIVNNLISNAINYSAENSTINIELSQDEEAVFLKVIDHGSGINRQDLEHIFEWYYQANTTLKKDGSGIGLALSRRFALLHNGTLAVESKLGAGSTFTLKLPKDDSLVDAYLEENIHATENKKFIEASIQSATENGIETQTTQAMRIKPESQRALILVIDDNPDILDFLDTSLSQNYDLIQAENGEEGIAQACKHVPDLIISDVMMPIKNGIDLCNYIKNRKETSHIPIILLSAKSNTEMIATGYTEGADDYILKPFNLQLLKARIENLIDSRKRLLKAYSENENTLETVDDDQKRLLDVEKKFLVEFHQIVEGQMQQGIKTVEVVAQEIGMSRSSLYRKIKAITGKNINEYIRNIKLDKAAQLIEKEQFTISQAAYEVGFGDAKYFRKIFKERFGKTPSAFKPN
ncbi:two-component regulator propeller domain-containing protein [Leeuwenhoekiella sp. ZYFB001]|uniref:hybrid sensor histidine kinase/response regulator transcription factor n=1 Tax=Leeuwenhoekiella sp. ZYFB001 TaxID=2719912 RepID=UPI0014304295|nr:two-component regulator propeller domain-containing protein [Leeuwenhoekiella sp. ZYFB001]